MSSEQTWTISELHEALEKFEADARRWGLAEASVKTYVSRSAIFVRWLEGDFQFRGPNSR